MYLLAKKSVTWSGHSHPTGVPAAPLSGQVSLTAKYGVCYTGSLRQNSNVGVVLLYRISETIFRCCFVTQDL